MRTKKQEGFDSQNFEKDALRALYDGKSLEEALGPLLKRMLPPSTFCHGAGTDRVPVWAL